MVEPKAPCIGAAKPCAASSCVIAKRRRTNCAASVTKLIASRGMIALRPGTAGIPAFNSMIAA
jgi:hypothetical protein